MLNYISLNEKQEIIINLELLQKKELFLIGYGIIKNKLLMTEELNNGEINDIDLIV